MKPSMLCRDGVEVAEIRRRPGRRRLRDLSPASTLQGDVLAGIPPDRAAHGRRVAGRRPMNVVLDTCALLALAAGDLSPQAVSEIRRADQASVSSVTAWEIAIKVAAGSLNWTVHQSAGSRTCSHTANSRKCSWMPNWRAPLPRCRRSHRDPFDRAIVALAQATDSVVITSDERIGQYPGVTVRWYPEGLVGFWAWELAKRACHHLRHQELRHDEEGASLARCARRRLHVPRLRERRASSGAACSSWAGVVGLGTALQPRRHDVPEAARSRHARSHRSQGARSDGRQAVDDQAAGPDHRQRRRRAHPGRLLAGGLRRGAGRRRRRQAGAVSGRRDRWRARARAGIAPAGCRTSA